MYRIKHFHLLDLFTCLGLWFPLCLGSSGLNGQNPPKVAGLPHSIISYGGLIRADTTVGNIFLVFTGGDYNDGGPWIKRMLRLKKVPANFFFTGDFYRNKENKQLIKALKRQGHYLGAHSDKHLLYAAWEDRDSLLVTREAFTTDLLNNYRVMSEFGIRKQDAPFFMPPYEWYNQTISDWTSALGLQLINFTPGTRSNADYTTPDMGYRYVDSRQIYNSILQHEQQSQNGLNGFILLVHIGTHPDRTDKFYQLLPSLIDELRNRAYRFARLPELIGHQN